jgi:hypothetical protein
MMEASTFRAPLPAQRLHDRSQFPAEFAPRGIRQAVSSGRLCSVEPWSLLDI